MNCIVIGGFLGSGKTTFINHLIKRAGVLHPGMKTALLINEFGEIPVDSAMMDAGNYIMREVTGGCICCSLKGMLSDTVKEIREKEDPDLLIVEATGLAVPSEIAASVGTAGGSSVFSLLCVDPAQHRQLAGKLAIYNRQLADADIILLTKEDLRSSELIKETADALNTGTGGLSDRCAGNYDAACELVFGCFAAAPETETRTPHRGHGGLELKQDICQVTKRFSGVFVPAELESMLCATASDAGPDLYRIKGIVETGEGWMAVQFADGVMSLKPADPPEAGESFIVFIGGCEAVGGLKL